MKKRCLAFILSFAVILGMFPTASAFAATTVKGETVASARHWSAAIDEDGNLYTWGSNNGGYSLGRTTAEEDNNPPEIILKNIQSVSISQYFGAAIDKNGGLWVWGCNKHGCLGIGSNAEYITTPVKAMDNAAYVDVYSEDTVSSLYMAVIDKNGSLWMSGSNRRHQISSKDTKSFPKLTKIWDNVAQVAVSESMTAIVDTKGGLWIWGWDISDIFEPYWGKTTGYGYIVPPTKIRDNVRFVEMPARYCFAFIDTSDTLWMYGQNRGYIWGNGITEWGQDVKTPIPVMKNVDRIVTPNEYTAVALDKNGDLWTIGNNDSGILGVGDTDQSNSSNVFQKVLEDVVSVDAANTVLAICENGDLYGWGHNVTGQLGTDDYDFTNRSRHRCQSKPVKVMDDMASPTEITLTAAQPAPSKPAPSKPAASQPAKKIAFASPQKIMVDGKEISFDAYAVKDAAGNPTNYVKLRDIAVRLNGSSAQFDVKWDGAVNIVTNTPYTPVGSELHTPYSGDRAYKNSVNPTLINSVPEQLDAIIITDDKGGGHTYYKLRDLGKVLNFNVGWSSETGVYIQTNSPYAG